VQNLVQLRFTLLDLSLFVVEPPANRIAGFLGTELSVGLLEAVVVGRDLVPQLTVDVHKFAHQERSYHLVLDRFLAKFIDVDEGVCCFE
jgi:hypothetical protein